MKEIKFRIWDVDFERYFYNVGVLNGQWYIAFDDDEPDAFDCIDVPDEKEFIIEQFTGVYDKNGEEIYEGDIVELDGSDYIVKWQQEYARFILEYGLNEIMLKPMKMKVVGNVHEGERK